MSPADRLFGWDAPSDEIRSELVEHRHRSTRKPVIFANILVAAIIAATLWKTESHVLLLGWLSAIAGVALVLVWSMAYYARHKNAHSPQHWAVRFSLGGLVNGIAWGSGALLLFDPATPDSNILMIGVICGMTAGNIVTSFAVPLSAYSYLVPAIALSMYMPLTQGALWNKHWRCCGSPTWPSWCCSPAPPTKDWPSRFDSVTRMRVWRRI